MDDLLGTVPVVRVRGLKKVVYWMDGTPDQVGAALPADRWRPATPRISYGPPHIQASEGPQEITDVHDPNWLPDVHAARVHQDPGGSREDAGAREEDRLRRRAAFRARAGGGQGGREDSRQRRPDLRRDAHSAGSDEIRTAARHRGPPALELPVHRNR